jgi:AraC family transcriptional regulator of adaptative response / DNA-3-methyladenine glycosylase II
MRRLLDLDADPHAIADDLGQDRVLARILRQTPGVRSPGEVDGTDAAVRSVLHQQVSLASAVAVASRLVAAHGIPLTEPVGDVRYAFPPARTWAELDPADLGMPSNRARALVDLCAAIDAGRIDVSPWADRSAAIAAMQRVAGVGPWTANLVAARALGDPDAFGAGDLVLVRQAQELGLASSAPTLAARAERWRPWRSYAMHLLWNLHLDEKEQR